MNIKNCPACGMRRLSWDTRCKAYLCLSNNCNYSEDPSERPIDSALTAVKLRELADILASGGMPGARWPADGADLIERLEAEVGRLEAENGRLRDDLKILGVTGAVVAQLDRRGPTIAPF